MSNLSSNFDIIRGWPNGSALYWEFKQKSGVTPNITEGTVVAAEAGTIPGKPVADRYVSAATSSGNLDNPWIVIQGRDQYDGQFTGTLTCIKLRTGLIFKVACALSPFPAVGDAVWATTGGVITNVDPGASALSFGKVTQIDPVNGWITVES